MGAQQSTAVKITNQDRAILDLKLQRDKLKQYQRKIEHVLEREREVAQAALARGDKARALTALRQRKYQEQLLSRTDTQLSTLQGLVTSIEFSLVEKSVFEGLKQGSGVLKELQQEMSLDAVERLMEESAEGVAYQKEIDEALQGKMSADEEDAVQAELAALVALQTPAATAVEQQTEPEVRLPDVPQAAPVEAGTTATEREAAPRRERTREEREMVPA